MIVRKMTLLAGALVLSLLAVFAIAHDLRAIRQDAMIRRNLIVRGLFSTDAVRCLSASYPKTRPNMCLGVLV
jgi:hypothetical protein